jgi:hypothetical protein
MKRFLLIAVIVIVPAFAAGYYYYGEAQHGYIADPARIVILTPERKEHILYGDEHGGGHLHGIGKPCKSEFPQDWDAAEIIETTERIAANDNLNWEAQRNGYYVAESNEGDVRVRVVLGPQRQHIITAYPVNVERNPCPANDND